MSQNQHRTRRWIPVVVTCLLAACGSGGSSASGGDDAGAAETTAATVAGESTTPETTAAETTTPEATTTTAATPATPQTQAIRVTTPLPARMAFGDRVAIGYNSDSGLPVVATTSPTCRVRYPFVEATGVGACVVTLTQPGDGAFRPATAVTVRTTIDAAQPVIRSAAMTATFTGKKPFRHPLTWTSTVGSITYTASGDPACTIEGSELVIDIEFSLPQCRVTGAVVATPNFKAASLGPVSFVLNPQTIVVEISAVTAANAVGGRPAKRFTVVVIGSSGFGIEFDGCGDDSEASDSVTTPRGFQYTVTAVKGAGGSCVVAITAGGSDSTVETVNRSVTVSF